MFLWLEVWTNSAALVSDKELFDWPWAVLPASLSGEWFGAPVAMQLLGAPA